MLRWKRDEPLVRSMRLLPVGTVLDASETKRAHTNTHDNRGARAYRRAPSGAEHSFQSHLATRSANGIRRSDLCRVPGRLTSRRGHGDRHSISEQGISVDDWNKTFRSFAVESKLKRAINLTKRYQIQSVPQLVINGKYLTTGKGIKNFNDMLAVADELIAMERSDR